MKLPGSITSSNVKSSSSVSMFRLKDSSRGGVESGMMVSAVSVCTKFKLAMTGWIGLPSMSITRPLSNLTAHVILLLHRT